MHLTRTLPLKNLFLVVLMTFSLCTLASDNRQSEAPENVKITFYDGIGLVFVTSDNFSLYSWSDDDRAHHSTCNNNHYSRVLGRGQAVNYLPSPNTRPTCEKIWPPFRPSDINLAIGSQVGHWQVMERHDGSKQWSYEGKPVYRSFYDLKAGETHGVGRHFFGRTSLIGRTLLSAPSHLPAGFDTRITDAGFTLTNSKGFTLYNRRKKEADCSRQCEREWLPMFAPASLHLRGDSIWSITIRDDGSLQWSRSGQPLYTYAEDTFPGDVNGSSLKKWQPVVLFPATEPPPEITVQMTGDGEVYADKKGMTLYSFYCFDEAPDHLPCDTKDAPKAYRLGICGTPKNCINTWKPVVASKKAMPVGNTWTIVSVDPTGEHLFSSEDESVNPLRAWAYKGRPVFTYIRDKIPGDVSGNNVSHRIDWGYWRIKK